MVDYTKPAMRDETWRRWKGGKKLADELRNFFTNQRVWDRLAAQNPMGPSQGPKARTGCAACKRRREALGHMFSKAAERRHLIARRLGR